MQPISTPQSGVSSVKSYSPSEADAYKKGYEEAILMYTTSSALSEARKSHYRSILPKRAVDIALDYPLVTTAAIGAVGAGTVYCGARTAGWALRRFFPRTMVPSIPSDTSRIDLAKIDVLAKQMEGYDTSIKELKGGMAPINGLLTRALNQNKMILQILESRSLQSDAVPSGTIGSVSAANQVGSGARKDATVRSDKDRSIMLFKDQIETRLRDLEDQVVMSNKDRRTELQWFRNELMGQLKVIEDQVGHVGTTSEVSIAHLHEAIGGLTKRLRENATLPKANARSVPQVSGTANADAHFLNVESSGDKVHIKYHVPVSTPPPEDHTAAGETRQALYNNMAAAREENQAIMDALPTIENSPDAHESARETSETQDSSKRSKAWLRRAKRLSAAQSSVNSELPAEGSKIKHGSVQNVASLNNPEKDLDTVAGSLTRGGQLASTERDQTSSKTERPAGQTMGGDKQDGARASSQTASTPNIKSGRKTIPIPTESASASTGSIYRLGVDDSGNWRVVLHSGQEKQDTTAGWRIADVIYETGSSSNGFGPFFAFASMSSGQEVYRNVKIFVYPEFDIIRLDGQLWRCSKQGQDLWVIKEKLGDMTMPEWDGVGYEKE